MFVCLTCGQEFKAEESMQKHFLACWKEQHPYHKSKPMKDSPSISARKMNDDMKKFFERLNNGRNFN